MSMPTGDSPQKAEAYYHYLQSKALEPHGRTVTWHVDWTSLRWLWGFVIVLVVLLLLWVRQYRSTLPRIGINPLDTWAGFTSEGAGPVSTFFLFIAVVVVVFGAVLVIGHLSSGQVF
jgi:hypothetical protein